MLATSLRYPKCPSLRRRKKSDTPLSSIFRIGDESPPRQKTNVFKTIRKNGNEPFAIVPISASNVKFPPPPNQMIPFPYPVPAAHPNHPCAMPVRTTRAAWHCAKFAFPIVRHGGRARWSAAAPVGVPHPADSRRHAPLPSALALALARTPLPCAPLVRLGGRARCPHRAAVPSARCAAWHRAHAESFACRGSVRGTVRGRAAHPARCHNRAAITHAIFARALPRRCDGRPPGLPARALPPVPTLISRRHYARALPVRHGGAHRCRGAGDDRTTRRSGSTERSDESVQEVALPSQSTNRSPNPDSYRKFLPETWGGFAINGPLKRPNRAVSAVPSLKHAVCAI